MSLLQKSLSTGVMATPSITGNYSLVSSNSFGLSRIGSSLPSKSVEEKTVRKSKRKVIYPFFTLCGQHTTDPFWKEMFDQFSRGKFPTNFTYCEDQSNPPQRILCHNNKKKNSSKILLEPIPAEAESQCEEFFYEKGGIASNIYIKKTQVEIKQTLPVIKVKLNLSSQVCQYCEMVAEQMKLDEKQKGQLLSLLKEGVIRKLITRKTVSINQSNDIIQVQGLHYNTDTGIFGFDLTKIPKTKTVVTRKPTTGKNKDFSGYWQEILECYQFQNF